MSRSRLKICDTNLSSIILAVYHTPKLSIATVVQPPKSAVFVIIGFEGRFLGFPVDQPSMHLLFN